MQTLKEHKEETLKAFQEEFGIHFKDSAGELKFAQTFIEEALDKQIEIIKGLLPEEISQIVLEEAKSIVKSLTYPSSLTDIVSSVDEIFKGKKTIEEKVKEILK